MFSTMKALEGREAMSTPAQERVSEGVFLGISWCFTCLPTIFVLFRLAVRIHTFRRLFLDDLFVVLAWMMTLASTILWQIKAPMLYEQFRVVSGEEPLTWSYLERFFDFIPLTSVFFIFYYTSLWCVKVSLLLFFRKLGKNVRSHHIAWWCITVVVLAGYAASMVLMDFPCLWNGMEWIAANCSPLSRVEMERRHFFGSCVIDVITDVLILSIPIRILWKVQIPFRRKVILLSVFSTTILVMVVAIIRVAVVTNPKESDGLDWLFLWSNVEVGTAIIVACVASFRQLFVGSQSQRSGESRQSTHERSFLSFLKRKPPTLTWGSSHGDKSTSHTKGSVASMVDRLDSAQPSESQTQIIPLDAVHVRHSVDVSNGLAPHTNPTAPHDGFV